MIDCSSGSLWLSELDFDAERLADSGFSRSDQVQVRILRVWMACHSRFQTDRSGRCLPDSLLMSTRDTRFGVFRQLQFDQVRHEIIWINHFVALLLKFINAVNSAVVHWWRPVGSLLQEQRHMPWHRTTCVKFFCLRTISCHDNCVCEHEVHVYR